MAITLKIPDLLLGKPEGLHISEIGKETGADQEKLGRILRLLASKHIFREGIPPSFKLKSLSPV